MSDEQAIVRVEPREIEFYGDLVQAIEFEGEVYIPARPISDLFGLTWGAQFNRIKRTPILARNQRVFIMNTRSRGPQEMVCLHLKVLPGWLFGITTSQVKEELREKIERYQTECYDVLYEHFRGRRNVQTDLTELSNTLTQFIDRASNTFVEHDERISNLEDVVAPGDPISKKQIGIVKNRVQALASEMTRRSTDKDAPKAYGRIYAALYRTFGAASLDDIRQSDYADVLAVLNQWREDADLDRQLGLFDTP